MLEINNLRATRGDFDLNIENLRIRPNSVNLVLGPNGGGKTTLLRSIAGLIDHRGDVILGGVTVSGLSFKERAKVFGYLSQGIYLSEITVRDFLILGRFPYTSLISRYSRSDWEKVNSAAEMFNLEDYIYRDITTLSQGELQRVLLAKVFIQEPKVLLLDFKQLVKEQIYKYLEFKPGAAILISTHEPNIFIDRTDNVIMLKGGKVFDAGHSSKIYNDGNIKKLFGLS
jgi:iron complex transport system ATP-binding protein